MFNIIFMLVNAGAAYVGIVYKLYSGITVICRKFRNFNFSNIKTTFSKKTVY